jgi:hypothetical protein
MEILVLWVYFALDRTQQDPNASPSAELLKASVDVAELDKIHLAGL